MKVSPRSHLEARSNKRQRVDHGTPPPASLVTIPLDCLLAVALWLELDDLNTLSLCNKHLRDARCHASLDQTRIGTVIFRPESTTTFSTLYDRIVNEGWNQAFQASRTHLRIVHIANLKLSLIGQLRKQIKKEKVRLTGVTRLDISGDYAENGYSIITDRAHHKALSLLLSNLISLDLSFVWDRTSILEDWARNCSSLESITWAGKKHLWGDGRAFERFPNLRELNLSRAQFYYKAEEPMFSFCRKLERLDIRGATWSKYPYDSTERPFSVTMISKLLNKCSSMGWLACDLSPADKNDLEEKFPHVTFVT